MSPPSLRHLLVLSATLACFQGCTCQGRTPPSPSTADAGTALAPPSPAPLAGQAPPSEPPVPERAMQLHAQGRKHGSMGEFELALRFFNEAREAAPTWPLPLYDTGLTFLYMKVEARALEAFTELDKLAPQGFADSKRMLDSLRRETEGRVPKGTLNEFLDTMRLRDLEEIRKRLEAQTKKAPAFVPAWMELARISSETPEEAQRLVAKTLSLEPDPGSRAEMLVYQAVLLRRQGQTEAFRKQLEAVRDDPNTPPNIVAEARELLSIPDNVVP